MKNVIKSVIFVLLCVSLFGYVVEPVFYIADDNCIEMKTAFNTFYGLKENTVDVLFVSPSSYETFWQSPKAYNDTGIAAFGLTASFVPLSGVKYIVEQAMKTQKPEVVVIDLVKVARETKHGEVFNIASNLKNITIKYNAINSMSRELDITGEEYDKLCFYIPFVYTHNKWSRVAFNLYYKVSDAYFMGYFHEKKANIGIIEGLVEEPDWSNLGKFPQPLISDRMNVLNDLLDYCDKLPCEVLFLSCPQKLTPDEHNKVAYARSIAEQRGYKVVNAIPLMKEIGLDFQEDYYDTNHTNYKGAQKFTEWFSGYLKENYDLTDRRGNPDYEFWRSEYERLQTYILNNG